MNEILEQCRAMMEAMTGDDGTSSMAGMMPVGGGMGMSFIGYGWAAAPARPAALDTSHIFTI